MTENCKIVPITPEISLSQVAFNIIVSIGNSEPLSELPGDLCHFGIINRHNVGIGNRFCKGKRPGARAGCHIEDISNALPSFLRQGGNRSARRTEGHGKNGRNEFWEEL